MPQRRGTATAIMTGAPMPAGADAVVIVEHTNGSKEGIVKISRRAMAGEHIRQVGEDVQKGAVVLEAGDRLGPAQVGLVASLGFDAVEVVCRPQVAILSTGDEVVAPGGELGPGQIYSSNNHSLVGLVLETGCVPLDMGIARDNLQELTDILKRCLAADVVLTTGGVSVGAYDFVKEAFARIGAEMGFWKVRLKPGKPLALGKVVQNGRTTLLFGLPGNPVSCMVNYLEFVRPWLLQSMGVKKPFLPIVDALCDDDLSLRPGRWKALRVTLNERNGKYHCRSTGTQSSGVLTSMARAQGLLLVEPDVSSVRAGSSVRVQLLSTSFLERGDLGFGA